MKDQLRVFDRISRSWSTTFPAEALSGQYLIEGWATLGGVGIGPRGLIVDDGEEALDLAASGTTARLKILHGDNDASMDAALEVAAQVRQWTEMDASWSDIVRDVAPLIHVAGVSDLLDADPLEEAFHDRLPEMRQVYLKPFTELQFDTERLPVARARRVSRRATQVLAARTEDWLRVGAGGVTPRRIESLVRDEVVDLYENRVGARLLDEIRRHLKRTLADYEQLDELVGHELVGWWRQQHRLSQLWGSQPPGNDLRALLRRRRSHIEQLLRAGARLRDGRLYQGVPARARVQQPIRVTNLFADDPNYRALRQVWIEWWRSRGDRSPPEDRRASRLRQTEAFETFGWLTVGHALNRMEPPAEASDEGVDPTEPVVRTPWGRISLTTSAELGDAAWRLLIDATPGNAEPHEVLILPLGCEILSGTDTSVRRRLDILTRSTARRSDSGTKIILYPGTGHDLRQLPVSLRRAAHSVPPLRSQPTSEPDTWIIPISPLDLESIERVERAIRWIVLSRAFSHYPSLVAFPSRSRALLDRATFLDIGDDRDEIVVVGIPRPDEWDALERGVETESRRLETQPRQRGVHEAADLRSALGMLRSASERLGDLARCPVCFGTGRFDPRSAGTYEGSCRDCGSRWGLRHDPSSARPIPYLWISDEPAKIPAGPGLDRWLGRDVLASPCQHPSAAYGEEIVNPWNGQCTAPVSQSTTCERCIGAREASSDDSEVAR